MRNAGINPKLAVLAVSVTCMFLCHAAAGAGIGNSASRAEKHFKDGKYTEALSEYENAISRDPAEAILQYNKAVTLYKKTDFKEAHGTFMSVLATGEETLEQRTFYNMGNTRYRIGEAAEKTDPKNALKKYREALKYYERAIELDPDDLDPKFNYELTEKKVKELEQKTKPEDKKEEKKDKDEKDKKDSGGQSEQKDEKSGTGQNAGEEKKEDQEKPEEKEENPAEENEKKEEEKDKEGEPAQDELEEQQEEDEPEEQEGADLPHEGGQKESPAGGLEQHIPGQMSQEEAENILRGQEEEEDNLRADMKERRKGGYPVVIKDW